MSDDIMEMDNKTGSNNQNEIEFFDAYSLFRGDLLQLRENLELQDYPYESHLDKSKMISGHIDDFTKSLNVDVELLYDFIIRVQKLTQSIEEMFSSYIDNFTPTLIVPGYIFSDVEIDKLTFDLLDEADFNFYKEKNNLLWLNLDRKFVKLNVLCDSKGQYYAELSNRRTSIEPCKSFNANNLDYFTYTIEKEIYDKYVDWFELYSFINNEMDRIYNYMELMEIDISDVVISEPKKEKTTNPKPFIPKLELKGNWKEFMKLFFAKEVTDKYDNPLMDENEVEQFIKQNFDEDYKGEFKTFDPKCNQSVYSEFASRFQYFISEKQNSWKLASILINNFKTFHTTHLWKTEFINDEPSKELKGFIKSLPSVSGNYFDYRKYFNADGTLKR